MIEFESVTKTYAGRIVVDRLTLHIPAGQSTVLIGPSGCGKSTTLRMINRLIDPERGVVRVGGQDVASADPQTLRRGIGYAIQAGGLFPHWTVARNIATVPRLLGWPRARIGARVAELLVLLGLPAGQFADKFPAELSGGQQQRVGVARALAAEPKLLLLDEPFGALDPITRFGLQRALRDIQRTNRQTMVFVTHDMGGGGRHPGRASGPPAQRFRARFRGGRGGVDAAPGSAPRSRHPAPRRSQRRSRL